jgi:hypothetical protein
VKEAAAAGVWIKGSEHAGRFEHSGLGEGIGEGALAGVGIPDKGDHRDRDCLAALPLLMADAVPNAIALLYGYFFDFQGSSCAVVEVPGIKGDGILRRCIPKQEQYECSCDKYLRMGSG